MKRPVGIWCLEKPGIEGPSNLRFFDSQDKAVRASGLSYLNFTLGSSRNGGNNSLTARSDKYPYYALFYVWEVTVEN